MTERVFHPELAAEVARDPTAVQVRGEHAHHLVRVTRVRVGDAVEVFDGKGFCCDATVTAVLRDAVTLSAGALRVGVRSDASEVTLMQGVPKGDKLDAIVRQATELGVHRVWPVFTERSVPRARDDRGDGRTERWQRIAEEAARQCGRSDVPTIRAPVALDAGLRRVGAHPDFHAQLVAWESSKTPLRAVGFPSPGAMVLLVGPEGGLSEREVELARTFGFIDFSLGPRVLRAETAAIAALAMLSLLRGDLGQW